jgi:hypothetical protein
MMQAEETPMDSAAQRVVELGNQLVNQDSQADPWDIADGLLAGAIHYWLYSRQPCSDPMCEDCAAVSTAELRMSELQSLLQVFARESDYFHSLHDSNAGRA